MIFDSSSFAAFEKAMTLLRDGRDLNAVAAAQLEEQLVRDPENLRLRCLLVGYYHRGRPANGDPDAATKLNAHLSWLIKHDAEHALLKSPVYPHRSADEPGFQRNARHWENRLAVARPSVTTFQHAASFFLVGDTGEQRDRDCVNRAIELHPDHPWGYSEHARQLWSDARSASSESERMQLYVDAYAWILEAHAREDEEGQDEMLEELTHAAYEAGRCDAAERHAESMLANPLGHYNPGQRTYEAHRLLGHMALDRGDLAAARTHLRAAAAAWTSQPSFMGPCLSLARAFLDRGEAAAVEEHLRTLRTTWSRGWESLDGWLAAIARGERPTLRFRPRSS